MQPEELLSMLLSLAEKNKSNAEKANEATETPTITVTTTDEVIQPQQQEEPEKVDAIEISDPIADSKDPEK